VSLATVTAGLLTAAAAAGAATYPVLLEALSALSALSLVFTVVYSRRHLPQSWSGGSQRSAAPANTFLAAGAGSE
jgi:hypothetical protein